MNGGHKTQFPTEGSENSIIIASLSVDDSEVSFEIQVKVEALGSGESSYRRVKHWEAALKVQRDLLDESLGSLDDLDVDDRESALDSQGRFVRPEYWTAFVQMTALEKRYWTGHDLLVQAYADGGVPEKQWNINPEHGVEGAELEPYWDRINDIKTFFPA